MTDALLSSLSASLLDRFEERLREACASNVLQRRPYDRVGVASPIAAMLDYHLGYHDPTHRRGKRVRPRLLFSVVTEFTAKMGFGTLRTHNEEHALAAAVAIEMLHNYSLIHDDIEDGDELRHGRPTLWARHGVAQALNAGDALCASASLALLHSRGCDDAATVARMMTVVHEAHLAMCRGQALDLSFEEATSVDLTAYEAMIAGKTAAMFAAAAELGAIAAGADEARIAACAEVGFAVGHAFQIADDAAGLWGRTATTGKPDGADLRRRKWTYPVVWALAQPPSTAQQRIAAAYRSHERLASADLTSIEAAFTELHAEEALTTARESTWQRIERLIGEATLSLDGPVARCCREIFDGR